MLENDRASPSNPIKFIFHQVTMSSTGEQNASIPELAMVPRDKNGNDIMSLGDIGLEGSIRTNRFGGRLYFAKIDVAMAVTGKNNDQAGNF